MVDETKAATLATIDSLLCDATQTLMDAETVATNGDHGPTKVQLGAAIQAVLDVTADVRARRARLERRS
jgi:hypothetical protein